jgi:eukaryotic-like serine/threonine-protein kinase
MVVTDTLINQVFDGRYRVLRRLGSGGMADVYLAEDQELGRQVAIKILNDRHANDEQFVERFRREAKNAARLSHPNIVSIYDRGEAEGSYYIAMEYLDGRTLKELIVSRGPSPVGVAIDYTRQILAAIGFAHRNGIVHRDIKPHNVVVGADGRLKVTDFGIARSGASEMTEAGSIIGTAQYLSPEQAKGAPVDARSDLYSVGIVLYEMLTGTVPFTGDTPLEIAMKHLSTVPQPPSKVRPEIPHELDQVVLRALAKNPEDRYHSAEEMDADLTRVARGGGVMPETAEAATAVLAGAGITDVSTTAVTRAPTIVTRPRPPAAPPPAAPPPEPYYGYEEPPRRRPFWPWLLALAILAAAGIGGYLFWGQIQDQLNANKPVAVPLVRGENVALAVENVQKADLVAKVIRHSHPTAAVGVVYDQSPDEGTRIDRGSTVKLYTSTGAPKTTVPDVRGKASDDAVSELKDAHLEPKLFYLNSSAEAGTVTGQDPKPDTVAVWGTSVRINISKGPEPVSVPSVVHLPYDQALGQLQDLGFAVARQDVDSNEVKDTVISQDPAGNTEAPPGSTVTLFVSKGPKTATVPDVTGATRKEGARTLHDQGFRIYVVVEDTTEQLNDGIVIAQDPPGNSEAPIHAIVTITVGHYLAPPPPPPPPPPPTTTTTVPTTTETTPTTTETTPTTTETVPTTTETTPTDTTTTTTTTIPAGIR